MKRRPAIRLDVIAILIIIWGEAISYSGGERSVTLSLKSSRNISFIALRRFATTSPRNDKNRAMRRDRAKTGCGRFRTSRGTLTRNEAHPRSNYYFPFWREDWLFIPCLRLRAIKRTVRFRCDRFGCGAYHRPTTCDRQGASFRCLNPLKAS